MVDLIQKGLLHGRVASHLIPRYLVDLNNIIKVWTTGGAGLPFQPHRGIGVPDILITSANLDFAVREAKEQKDNLAAGRRITIQVQRLNAVEAALCYPRVVVDSVLALGSVRLYHTSRKG